MGRNVLTFNDKTPIHETSFSSQLNLGTSCCTNSLLIVIDKFSGNMHAMQGLT